MRANTSALLFTLSTTGLAAACLSTPSAAPAPGASPAAATSAASPTASLAEAPVADATPRLVVLVVVDQLPAWGLAARLPHARDGFARLRRDGRHFTRAEIPYAATYTAPGHAALVTGASPAQTGILANEWFDADAGRVRSSVDDPAAPLFDLAGRGAGPVGPGASPSRLRVDTVGDVLRDQTGGVARVVSVSLKDRGAVLTGGHLPSVVVWYDAVQGAFTTSSFYADAPPPWLDRLARTQPVSARLDHVWSALDPALLARAAAFPDDSAAESDCYGLGRTLPKRLGAAHDPRKAVMATPLGDELVVDTALAALDGEALGQDDVPDLLAVSFSAHDYVGHCWGQESHEMLDEFLRLDAQLGRLMRALDERVGAGRWTLVLTSDHGAAPVPALHPERGGRVVLHAEVERAAEAGAARVVGPGDWFASAKDPTAYLSAAGRAHPERERLVAAAAAEIARVPGVGRALPTHALVGACDDRPASEALVCRTLDRTRSGEIYWEAAEGSIAMGDRDEATTHGSSHEHDRVVPIFVLGAGVVAGLDERGVTTLQVAPTLAALLGVPAPAAARATALVLGASR